jgi:galactokinase
MDADLAERLAAAPELRLASYTYGELFGHPPAGVWRAPGTVTLLADGPLRLTVAARWGAIVAATPRDDGRIEAIRMNRPDERVRLTLAEAGAGAGPSWAGAALRAARAGVTLLVNSDLPDGSGLGAADATQTAIRLALSDLGDLGAGAEHPISVRHEAGCGLLGDRRLPFDLDEAGLRLMIIDTRVRDVPPLPVTEHAPVREAAAALEAGRPEALGPMLTAAHAALSDALANARSAALAGGRLAGGRPTAGEPNAGEVQQIAVAAALDAGALGARMLIDGPGRPACALLHATLLTDVRRAITEAFSARCLRVPRLLTVAPADGPRRVG